jgi:hypothetical protein
MPRPRFAMIASPTVGEKRGSTWESKPKSISVCEGPNHSLNHSKMTFWCGFWSCNRKGFQYYRQKSDGARIKVVRRFLRSHRYVIRTRTHECQRNPEEMRNAAREFVTAFRPRLVTPDRDKRFVINMDQTPRLNSSMPTISTTTPLGWNAMLPMVLVYEV